MLNGNLFLYLTYWFPVVSGTGNAIYLVPVIPTLLVSMKRKGGLFFPLTLHLFLFQGV